MTINFATKVKTWLRMVAERWQIASLAAAARQQNLDNLAHRLQAIIPDLSDQYSHFKVEGEYFRLKCRTQHAFQIKLALRAIELLLKEKPKPDEPIALVDIGDSSGNHLTYLRNILLDQVPFNLYNYQTLSVNLDEVAVNKIKSKNLDALLVRAEDLFEKYGIEPDIAMSFEMLEHLPDPILFLDRMSQKSNCKYLVITVPYLACSRVGLHHIRHRRQKEVSPENTHIFELSPGDWKLIFQHSGWEVVEELISNIQYGPGYIR